MSNTIHNEQHFSTRFSLAERVLRHYLQGLRYGRITIQFDDGGQIQVCGIEHGPDAVIRIHEPINFIWRVLTRGDIGLAESYMKGDWDAPDLADLLSFCDINEQSLPELASAINASRLFDRLRHMLRRNHKPGSRRNIRRHYDLGNRFYSHWLDSTMTYSCANFDAEGESLQQAQMRKYQRMLESLGARAGQHILEIGCGWGGFAEFAAKQGYQVTGVTLSQEQLSYARQRIDCAGLKSRVELRLQDYRNISEKFDHIVSIEMFEAVGEDYWPTFFETLKRRLRPGGRAAVQTITIKEDFYESYRIRPDFIQLYIFPGGMLPSPSVFWDHTKQAGLVPRSFSFHRHDYALTLRHWHDNLQRKITDLRSLDYNNAFIRMWRYYLAYCEAGFNSGRIDLMQTVLERSPN